MRPATPSDQPGRRRQPPFDSVGVDGLTGACTARPTRNFRFQCGYRIGEFIDADGGADLLELEAAVPARDLCRIYFACIEQLDDPVDVVVEYGHNFRPTKWESNQPTPCQLYLAEQIAQGTLLRVLESHWRWLLFDGKCGLAVYSSESAGHTDATEVRLNDDKVLRIISDDLAPYRSLLEQLEVPFRPRIELVSDGAHTHYSTVRLQNDANQLMSILGAIDPRAE